MIVDFKGKEIKGGMFEAIERGMIDKENHSRIWELSIREKREIYDGNGMNDGSGDDEELTYGRLPPWPNNYEHSFAAVSLRKWHEDFDDVPGLYYPP